MALEFIAESIEKLKNRYPSALEKVWLPDAEMSDRPGLRRENVFDSENGIRLIISKEKAGPITTVIHFSGSVTEGFDKSKIGNGIQLLKAFVMQYREVSGDYLSAIRMEQISDGGIPHFIILN